PTVVPELVRLPLQDVEQLLVDVAAAVVADVDDDALRVPVPVDLVLEAPQRRLVHRADVDVRDLAARLLLDELPVARDPVLVADVRDALERADPDLARARTARASGHAHGHVLV